MKGWPCRRMIHCPEIFILCNENCPVKVAVFQDVVLCSVVKNLRSSVLKMETASAFKLFLNFYHFTWHRTLKTKILAVSVRISDLANDRVLVFAFAAVKALNLNFENA